MNRETLIQTLSKVGLEINEEYIHLREGDTSTKIDINYVEKIILKKVKFSLIKKPKLFYEINLSFFINIKGFNFMRKFKNFDDYLKNDNLYCLGIKIKKGKTITTVIKDFDLINVSRAIEELNMQFDKTKSMEEILNKNKEE